MSRDKIVPLPLMLARVEDRIRKAGGVPPPQLPKPWRNPDPLIRINELLEYAEELEGKLAKKKS